MKVTFALFILLGYSIVCLSQTNITQKRNIVLSDSTVLDSLKNIYKYNKIIPSEYEFPIYTALSYYPELDKTRIVFKKSKIKTTLNSRPTVTSLLFRKKAKRKYVVRINNTKREGAILFNTVPINAMIGLVGHEMGHFADYNNKNVFGIISRLLQYTNSKSKEKFEKEIDRLTIYRGLGWQLYDWSYFVLNESTGSEKYKNYKRLIYLEPKEIEEIIKKQDSIKFRE